MKKLFTLTVIMALTISVLAQPPQKISYQCVVRNASGVLVSNQGVGMRVSILQGSAAGAVVYQEIFNPNPETNDNGLLILEIGSGLAILGTFSTIDWSAGPFYLKTEADLTGATNYTIIGTSQLLSVPYALYAKQAETITEESQNLADVLGKGNDGNSMQIKNLANPTDAQDAVTKAYVDLLKSQIEELKLETGIKIKDIDGNVYNTVKIGNQRWMAENLKTTKLNDGTPIPEVTDVFEWRNTNKPMLCWYNNDSVTFHDLYGVLYNYHVVATNKLCPEGWHVPTDLEWSELEVSAGMDSISAYQTDSWRWTNVAARLIDNVGWAGTNDFGFSALPGGYRTLDAVRYEGLGDYAAFWTSTVWYESEIWRREIITVGIRRSQTSWYRGLSIRCIKD